MGAYLSQRRSPAFAIVTRLLVLALLPLGSAACSAAEWDLPGDGAASPSVAASQPADWPKAVPFYNGGTLSGAWVKPNGAAGAFWAVPDTKRSSVAAEYGRMLESAGFRRTEWFMDRGQSGFEYRGHGVTVSVSTLEVDGNTSLDVGVSP